MDPHTNRELQIFREFAAVCPLQIEVDSIEKRDPPEADILCKIADGTAVAFEMVELVDQQRIARPLADQDQLMDSMREAANALPEETINQLTNAWVGVKFRADKSLRKRKEFAVQIVRELAVNPAFEGEFQILDRNEQVAEADVRRRDGLAGPHFRVLAAGHYRPVPMDALDEKFEKQYPADTPIELLAHFDRQHAPLEEQIAELAAHIEANIGRLLSAVFGFSIATISESAIRNCNEAVRAINGTMSDWRKLTKMLSSASWRPARFHLWT